MSKWLVYRLPAYWLMPPIGVAIAFGIAWWAELRPAATEWGSVSSWVATIGGLVALTFAGSQLRLVLLQRRQAMGESLAVIPHTLSPRAHHLTVALINAGQFGVTGVRVMLVEASGDRWEERGSVKEPPGGVVAPGITASVSLALPTGAQLVAPDGFGVRVTFTDVEGRSWARTCGLDGRRLD